MSSKKGGGVRYFRNAFRPGQSTLRALEPRNDDIAT